MMNDQFDNIMTCQIEGHKKSKIIAFCINTLCQSQSYSCVKCLQSYHCSHPRDCLDHQEIKIKIEEYIKRVDESFTQVQKELQKILTNFQTSKNQLIELIQFYYNQNFEAFSKNISICRNIEISLQKEHDLLQELQKQQQIEYLKYQNDTSEQFFIKGELLYNQNQFKQALEVFNECIKLFSNNEKYLFWKGTTLDNLNQVEQAKEEYQNVLRINENFDLALNNYGLILQKQEQYEQAKSLFKKAIIANPKNYTAYNNLGITLMKTKEYQSAFDEFCNAIQYCPDKPNYYIYKGLSLKSLGRYNEAIQCYDQALNYCFENEKDVVYYHKGFALFLSSNFMEASKAYEKAINIKENPNYFFNYGDSLSRLGKSNEAVQAYQRALSLDYPNKQLINERISNLIQN